VAWCLLAIVNVKAFGWRLPFHVFPAQLLWLVGIAMAAAFCASALPVARLARMQPASLIRILLMSGSGFLVRSGSGLISRRGFTGGMLVASLSGQALAQGLPA